MSCSGVWWALFSGMSFSDCLGNAQLNAQHNGFKFQLRRHSTPERFAFGMLELPGEIGNVGGELGGWSHDHGFPFGA